MYYLPKEKLDEREQIIFGRDYDDNNYRLGGIAHFDELSIPQLRKLLNAGLIDPNERQNESPTTKEILDFCSENDEDIWYVHGYVVSGQRGDCRVTLEGFGSTEPPTNERMIAFITINRFADNLLAGSGEPVYCWYD